MAAVLESRKAIFVKYVGLEECDRQSVDAVIIYVSDEVSGDQQFIVRLSSKFISSSNSECYQISLLSPP